MTDTLTKLKHALELDWGGDWDEAHRIVQGIESTDSYWIHAYLHRKEGDLENAWRNSPLPAAIRSRSGVSGREVASHL